MKRTLTLIFLAACISSSTRPQSTPKPQMPKECIPQPAAHGPFPKGPFKYKANESYKRDPLIKFQINQDGSVNNIEIVRSSGVDDIDRKMVDYVAKYKYKPRPAGCEIVESEGSIIIDWR